MKIKSLLILTFIALVTLLTATVSIAQETPQTEPQTQNSSNPATVKIGVALPKAQFSEGIDSAQMAAGLREMIAGYFKGTNVEIVALEARLPQAITSEAKEKGCAYVLQTAVTQKKGGGGFGMFKTIAPVLANVVPMAGMAGSVGGAIAGSVASTAIMSASNMASTTKAKDSYTFDYSLISTENNAVKLNESIKAKAKSDGEDVLSPLVEKMAEAILAATK